VDGHSLGVDGLHEDRDLLPRLAAAVLAKAREPAAAEPLVALVDAEADQECPR